MFFRVVTAEPWSRRGTIRETVPLAAVERSTTKPCPPAGVHGAARKIGLPARSGPVAPVDRLRCALAKEVDLRGGVDRHHLWLTGDDPRVVHPLDADHLDRRVVPDEVVEPLRAEREGRDDLAGALGLAHPGDRTAFDQVDHRIGEELGVDAEVAVSVQLAEDRRRCRSDPRLDRGALRDALGDQGADAVVEIIHVRRRHLDQRVVRLAPAEHL